MGIGSDFMGAVGLLSYGWWSTPRRAAIGIEYFFKILTDILQVGLLADNRRGSREIDHQGSNRILQPSDLH